MKIARVLDCDDTITSKIKGTLLEKLMKDYVKKQPFLKKLDLFFCSRFVKLYKEIIYCASKFFDDSSITGETTSLQVFDILMLRKAGMSLSFVEEHAKNYVKYIESKHINAFKNCKDDIYIVSAEPVQLLESIVRQAGISEHIKGIYGTRFKAKNGIITGFEKNKLFAGMRGKHIGMEKIISKNYDKVLAIGDSMADIGLFEDYKDIVVLYTFSNASKELVNYIQKNKGIIVNNLKEFFNKG